MRTSLSALGLLALAAAAPLGAQGALSTQGLGYPTGALSARALGTAGALGETDPESPVNPASLGWWDRSAIVLTYAPEFRTISVGGVSDESSVSRFPLLLAAVPVNRFVLGASVSTFLDRSFEVNYAVVDTLSGEEVTSDVRFSALGAMNDVRLAASYAVTPRLLVGLGVHGITGENRILVRQVFREAQTDPFVATDQIGFGGLAASAGVQWQPASTLLLAASARLGGRLHEYFNDTLAARATVPDRFGGEVLYTGIAGATIAARANWVEWSALEPLGDPEAEAEGREPLRAVDAWEFAVGADLAGPRLWDRTLPIRAGIGVRTLPFAYRGAEVEERTASVGIGVPFAGQRALVDAALVRAWRSAADIDENAWTIAFSLTLRP